MQILTTIILLFCLIIIILTTYLAIHKKINYIIPVIGWIIFTLIILLMWISRNTNNEIPVLSNLFDHYRYNYQIQNN